MYATLSDMQTRFGEREIIQLSDRSIPPTGLVDATVVDTALADASAEIDSWIMGRYPLPLGEIPPVLVGLCCDMARLRLCTDHPPENVREKYEQALGFLKAVQSGKAHLGLSGESESAQTSAHRVDYSASEPVFNSRSLKDY